MHTESNSVHTCTVLYEPMRGTKQESALDKVAFCVGECEREEREVERIRIEHGRGERQLRPPARSGVSRTGKPALLASRREFNRQS